MKFEKTCEGILQTIGGIENIELVHHCATRLRIKVKNLNKVSFETLQKIEKVLGVQTNENEVQIIMGLGVNEIYAEFVKYLDSLKGKVINKSSEKIEEKKEITKKKLSVKYCIDKAVDYLSGSLIPVIPVFITSGMLLAIVTICTSFLGLRADSGTVIILNATSIAGFYFMPILVGYCCAKKLNTEPSLGAFLGAILCFSTINGVAGLDFLGIKISQITYNNTMLPVLLGVLFMSYIYKFFKDRLPHCIRYFVLPTVTMLITVPVTLIVIGPIGNFLGSYLALGIQWLGDKAGFLAVGLWAFCCPIAIMTGMDKAVYMLNLSTLAAVGYDPIALPGGLAGNSAIGGAALACWFISKNIDIKSLGASSGITAIIGITEPALYGLCVRWKPVLISSMIGAGIGGCFAGLVSLKQYAYAGPGLITSPIYISPDGTLFNFYMCLATIAVSAIAGFIVTYLMCRNNNGLIEGK